MEEAEPLLIRLCQGLPTGRLETGANSHWCLSPARNITSKPDVENNKTKPGIRFIHVSIISVAAAIVNGGSRHPRKPCFIKAAAQDLK